MKSREVKYKIEYVTGQQDGSLERGDVVVSANAFKRAVEELERNRCQVIIARPIKEGNE